MNTAAEGERSPAAKPCTPWAMPYIDGADVNTTSSTICPTAPLVGTHLP